MKIFWPHRSKAKGFSIQNLAFQYREKFSNLSSNKVLDKFLAEGNLKSIIEDSNSSAISHFSINKGHWANRDFSEYREVA